MNGLRRHAPDLSAAEPLLPWQRCALVSAPVALVLTAAVDLAYAHIAVAAALVIPFCCVVALKAIALWYAVTAPRGNGKTAEPACVPEAWPRYTLLIPLYDEAAVVPDLIAALSRLDYPADRLEILLIVEEADRRTREAVAAHAVAGHMRIVVVPMGEPRTKPRALNYALRQASGELVVVYDAEDAPEPDQLRRAAACLLEDPTIGCLQARLNVINQDEAWLTRQFAIEYTTLFDCMLPALERLDLPIPLGGTSNHFRRSVLEGIGAWDPFNVTEDADLGIRLARTGHAVRVLASTTWEEAPATFRTWRNQRTRWLKGWMQTYLVHMRRPLRTARDLGVRRFLGFQVLMAGLILSALVHPWFYVSIAWQATFAPLAMSDLGEVSGAIGVLGLANLVLGYATGIALGAVAVAARGRRYLAVEALLMPFYWLLISLAAYRALGQLVTSPYRWEKTQHRARADFPATGGARIAAATASPRCPTEGAPPEPTSRA